MGTYQLANNSIRETGFTKFCLIMLWLLATSAYWVGAIMGSKDVGKPRTASNLCFEDDADRVVSIQHKRGRKRLFQAAIIIPALVNNVAVQARLRRSVESVLIQCSHEQVVVVVDDGSPIAINMNLDLSNFAVVRMSHNAGPAAARNTGAQYALERGAKTICFLDSDASADKEWFKEHLKMQAANPGIYGGLTTSSSAALVSRLHEYIGTLRGPLLPDGSLLYAPTCNLSVSSACWASFDETFKSAAFEDVEFCIRMRKQGWKTWLVATAVVYHEYETSLFGLWKQFYRYGKAEPKMIQKHREYPDWLASASTDYERRQMVIAKKND